MPNSSNYGFNLDPEFTVNHISEYLATDNATQRTRIIRRAKFPKKVEIAAYSQIRKYLQTALIKPDFNRLALIALVERLEAKARHESGYARDEALRCEQAVRAFIETMQPRMFSKLHIAPSRSSTIQCVGVSLRVTMDAQIVGNTKDGTYSGGLNLLYAFSAGRGCVKDRLSFITGMLLWSLESGQMEPLARFCMAADLKSGEIVKASASHSRFRQKVTESCHEIAARWSSIAPPDDYDGPDWRNSN